MVERAHEVVRWVRDQRPTALIIPVPEAHDVVAKWRQMYDPAAAAGIGPHITVLYPFMPERNVDDGVRGRLASIAANHAASSFELARTGRYTGLQRQLTEVHAPLLSFAGVFKVKISPGMNGCWPPWPKVLGSSISA